MPGTTVYEFDALVSASSSSSEEAHLPTTIPDTVFAWLESLALQLSGTGRTAWLRLGQRHGRRIVQVLNFVGVVRAPNGYSIEILPKVGKCIGGGAAEARKLLIDMLCCLRKFRHIQTDSAHLSVARMPLLEIFITEFLQAVGRLLKHGLRNDYVLQQENLFALRGKLLFTEHIKQNICRRDRFFAAFDEFSSNRPENRLLHAALCRCLAWTKLQSSLRMAHEFCFAFADVPVSVLPDLDFQRIRPDRAMSNYAEALAWARLILQEESPLTAKGGQLAPSLLFPMEALFEAFVANYLSRQAISGYSLKVQAKSLFLVKHQGQNLFTLKPDILIEEAGEKRMVLDTKWKLIDCETGAGGEKFGLSEQDFYQLYAYGQNYLGGCGEVALIYPKTDNFCRPLPVFEFSRSEKLRLWVLPFCLRDRKLAFPAGSGLEAVFHE